MDEQQQTKTAKNTIEIKEAGPCKKLVSIEIPEEVIRDATDEQYKELGKDAIVPGFRKGRAPRRLLEKRFGKEITEQVKLKLLADASDSAIKDNELDTIREPDIDFEKIELPDSGPLKFDFEIEVRPEFELPQLEAIPVNKTKLEVTDEQIDREIERLQKWSGFWTPRDDGENVQLEDQVIADVVLKTEGIEEQEKLDNSQIHVRQNGFVGAIPVEKLDQLLVGTKVNDLVQTSVQVPKTYFRQEYRGKKVDIQITIRDIKWLKPAELNEDFLKRFGVDDETELREKISDMLRSRLEQQSKNEMTEQIYKHMLDNTSFDLPTDIVADQAATLLKRQYANLIRQGLPREQIEEQMEQLRASSEQQAKEQLKTFFIMDKVAEKLSIDVSEEEINGHIAQLAIQQGRRPERMREDMVRNGTLAQFRLQVRTDKCIAKLLESAKITETKPKKKETKKAKKTKKTAGKTTKKTSGDKKKSSKKQETTSKKKTDK